MHDSPEDALATTIPTAAAWLRPFVGMALATLLATHGPMAGASDFSDGRLECVTRFVYDDSDTLVSRGCRLEPRIEPPVAAPSIIPGSGSATPDATGAATADTLSTMAVLASGGVELNPLGFVGATVAKFAVPNSDGRAKRSVWYGGAANNLLILAGAGGPVSAVIGLGVAIVLWTSERPQGEQASLAGQLPTAGSAAGSPEHAPAPAPDTNPDPGSNR